MYTLSGVPGSDTTLKVGSIVTFIVRITTTIMPSESTIKSTMQKDIDNFGIAETINVNRGMFSNDFNIAFRVKKGVTFGVLSNIIKNSFSISLGYSASIVDFKGEFYEAPSPISYIISPISKVAGEVPAALSSIKWIAIAGLGIIALFYVGPVISAVSKKVGKRIGD